MRTILTDYQIPELDEEEADPYALFVYTIRSPYTKESYFRRLRRFFDDIELCNGETFEERCNAFAHRGRADSKWAFNNILRFLQSQKIRAEKKEITAGTLQNYLKTIKFFCETTDIYIPWKKITRGLPKGKRYADDRAPTLEEIKKIIEYPDRRIKPVVYTMASSGIRVGAWDYLKWHHIHPIVRDGELIAAKMIVYAEENDEYFSFITAEAYSSLKSWMDFREECGERITKDSWVMRNLWDATKPRERGVITEPRKLTSIGIKRLVERALWAQGVRNILQEGKKRHEFQTDHGFRKWFRTRCELAGMKLSNIETLMNHSLGISDSYYRITESELIDDYLKAINFLIIDDQQKLQKQLVDLDERNRKQSSDAETRLQERDKDIAELRAAMEFLKNKMNAALISRPLTEVISNEKGIPRAIEINEINNTAVAEVVGGNS